MILLTYLIYLSLYSQGYVVRSILPKVSNPESGHENKVRVEWLVSKVNLPVDHFEPRNWLLTEPDYFNSCRHDKIGISWNSISL